MVIIYIIKIYMKSGNELYKVFFHLYSLGNFRLFWQYYSVLVSVRFVLFRFFYVSLELSPLCINSKYFLFSANSLAIYNCYASVKHCVEVRKQVRLSSRTSEDLGFLRFTRLVSTFLFNNVLVQYHHLPVTDI